MDEDSALSAQPQAVVVLSGPSGSGKTTVVERLINESPVPLLKSVSATTRPPRPGEVDGRAYYFLSTEEFERRRDAGEFIEYAEIFGSGHWYGTLKTEIRRAAQQHAWAFLEIDVQGALTVMRQYPRAIGIFMRTPSDAEFERRLRARGTESEDIIRRRLNRAREELQFADRYRYQVVNDDLDRAVREIVEILAKQESELNA